MYSHTPSTHTPPPPRAHAENRSTCGASYWLNVSLPPSPWTCAHACTQTCMSWVHAGLCSDLMLHSTRGQIKWTLRHYLNPYISQPWITNLFFQKVVCQKREGYPFNGGGGIKRVAWEIRCQADLLERAKCSFLLLIPFKEDKGTLSPSCWVKDRTSNMEKQRQKSVSVG